MTSRKPKQWQSYEDAIRTPDNLPYMNFYWRLFNIKDIIHFLAEFFLNYTQKLHSTREHGIFIMRLIQIYLRPFREIVGIFTSRLCG